jgi:hypothetical protein
MKGSKILEYYNVQTQNEIIFMQNPDFLNPIQTCTTYSFLGVGVLH